MKRIWEILKGTTVIAGMGPLLLVGGIASGFGFWGNSGHNAGFGAGLCLLALIAWGLLAGGCFGAAIILQMIGIPIFIGIPLTYIAGCFLAACFMSGKAA